MGWDQMQSPRKLIMEIKLIKLESDVVNNVSHNQLVDI